MTFLKAMTLFGALVLGLICLGATGKNLSARLPWAIGVAAAIAVTVTVMVIP